MPYVKQHFTDGNVLVADQLNHIEDGIEALENQIGQGGSTGGYYTPVVTQPTTDTMQVGYTPSDTSMPEVPVMTVNLPKGPAGKDGEDGYTPVKGTDYWTAADKQEMVEELTEQTAPVSYNAQTLTEEQKAQARDNIGAAAKSDSNRIYSTPDMDMGAFIRGITFADELKAPLIDFKKDGDKMVHVSTVDIIGDVAYCTYYANTRSAGEISTEHTARFAYCSLNDPSDMVWVDLQDVGETFNGKTVAEIYDTVMMSRKDAIGKTKVDLYSAFDGNAGYNIKLSYSVGETVPLTPEAVSGWKYAIVDCNEGDEFILNGQGGFSPRLWGFLDENNALLSVANSNVTAENLSLIAPVNAAKLVINSSYSYSEANLYQPSLYKMDEAPITDTLYLMWTARLDGVYCRLYRTYTISTGVLSDVMVNNFYVGGNGGEWSATTMKNALATAGISHKPIAGDIGIMQKLSERVEDGVTYYYTGAYATEFNCIVKSSDLINWHFVALPDFENDSQFENATYVIGDRVYYFVRQKWEKNTGFLTCYDLVKGTWDEPVYINDCQSRSDFFEYENRLYLVHAPIDRNHLSLLMVDTINLSHSYEKQTAKVPDYFYPYIFEYESELYMSFTASRQHIYLSKFTIDTVSNDAVISKFKELFAL